METQAFSNLDYLWFVALLRSIKSCENQIKVRTNSFVVSLWKFVIFILLELNRDYLDAQTSSYCFDSDLTICILGLSEYALGNSPGIYTYVSLCWATVAERVARNLCCFQSFWISSITNMSSLDSAVLLKLFRLEQYYLVYMYVSNNGYWLPNILLLSTTETF